MIFFCFSEDIKIHYKMFNNVYEHIFQKVEDPDSNVLSFDKIYFSTPSDFNTHMQNIRAQFPEKFKKGVVHILDEEEIKSHPDFPKDIGFKKNLEETLSPFAGREEPFRIGIVNAISNAIGDYLIGTAAYDYWKRQVEEIVGVPVEVTFFQLNPMRLGPITTQHDVKEIYIIPNRLSFLSKCDAFIDLGGLILRDNFDNQSMIDFFFEAFSLDSQSVPAEAKRIKYNVPEGNVNLISQMLNIIKKAKKRPILLFHHKSTSAVRDMSPIRARKFIKGIIDQTDWFVVSTAELDFVNDRFVDLSKYSLQSLHNFAAIIKLVDAIVTVDTSTYHIADAFDTPTLAMFTTIDPEYRVKYYPFVDSIMLESPDGQNYGKHKVDQNEKVASEEQAYTDSLWEKLSVEMLISKLEAIIERKREYEGRNSSGRIGNETPSVNKSDKQMSVASV